MRWLRHLFAASAESRFPDAVLDRIGRAIAAGERLHDGELVFAVEGGLPASQAWQGVTAAERADEVFARLRVWDTAANNGVLLYLLLADHAIEIVADRGLQAQVAQTHWQAICEGLAQRLHDGPAEPALIWAVEQISAVLAVHYPASGAGRDELPDRPVRL